MVIYPEEYFEKYWKKRQYKHPEEKEKQKKIARKFFYSGFQTGVFEARKEAELELAQFKEKIQKKEVSNSSQDEDER